MPGSRLTTLQCSNYNPVGRKRTRTLVAKSRACSSRCCGLSSVVYHGWEGKMLGEGRKLENCNRLLRLPL